MHINKPINLNTMWWWERDRLTAEQRATLDRAVIHALTDFVPVTFRTEPTPYGMYVWTTHRLGEIRYHIDVWRRSFSRFGLFMSLKWETKTERKFYI